MNSITVHAETELDVSHFKVALLTVPVPIDRVSYDVERGLASCDLPDQYDMVRLLRALDARGLKRFIPGEEIEMEARGAFQQFIDGICGGRAR